MSGPQSFWGRDAERRRVFVEHAERMMFLPYHWGGDDPMIGFDCSGLVVECLKAVGEIREREDYTADSIMKILKPYGTKTIPSYGSLVFWVDHGRAYHVGIAIGRYHCVSARGGRSGVDTEDEASKLNAFVTVRPIPEGVTIIDIF